MKQTKREGTENREEGGEDGGWGEMRRGEESSARHIPER